jgi:uncharacterized protein YcfL
MKRTRRPMVLLAALLGVGLSGLVAVQPANAATWIYNRNVGMGISVSNKHVSTADVQYYASSWPVTVTYHFSGYGSNGKPKGPQLSYTASCNYTCVHRFNVNKTYAKGDWVYGWVTQDGVVEGTPVYSF